jgi:hypothetical protein
MTLLGSILREKQLRRVQRLQQLATQRLRCAASAQTLATAKRLHDQARSHLWQVLTAAEMCVQQMSIARGREEALRLAAERGDRAHSVNLAALEELQLAAARIEKDIEKLEERFQRWLEGQAAQQLQMQWRELDDWVSVQWGRSS